MLFGGIISFASPKALMIDLYSYLSAAIGLVLFLVLPSILFILLPLLLSVWISKKFFGKRLKWEDLFSFITLVLTLCIVTNLIWNTLIFKKIYYEWDRLLFWTPFTLVFHETPNLGGTGSWIAQGWDLTSLQTLFILMLAALYLLAFLGSLLYFVKKHHYPQFPAYLKTITLSILILLTLPFAWDKGTPLIINNLNNRFVLQRTQNAAECSKPQAQDRIYFGGNEADYVSNKDGNNLQKVWDKPGSNGQAQGTPSPDGSKIVYVERDSIWIRCTATAGQYKIPFGTKRIAGLDKEIETVRNISWSPDSKMIAFNFGGDLIKVDTETGEKTVIYYDIALKDYGIDLTKPQPSGYYGPYYELGNVYWAKDGNLFYTKFLANNQVELHKIDYGGVDSNILTSNYPLIVALATDSQRLLIHETDWSSLNHKPTHFDAYVYNLAAKQKEFTLFGKKLTGDENLNINNWVNFIISPSKRYVVLSYTYPNLSWPKTNFPVFKILDTQTQQTTDIRPQIINLLRQQNLIGVSNDAAITLESYGFSNDDTLLITASNNGHLYITLTSDPLGKNIKTIFVNDRTSQSNSDFLYPKGWI